VEYKLPITILAFSFTVIVIGEAAKYVKNRWGSFGEIALGLGVLIVLMINAHYFYIESGFEGEKYIRVMASSAICYIPTMVLLLWVNRFVTVIKRPISRRMLAWALYLLVLFLGLFFGIIIGCVVGHECP